MLLSKGALNKLYLVQVLVARLLSQNHIITETSGGESDWSGDSLFKELTADRTCDLNKKILNFSFYFTFQSGLKSIREVKYCTHF